MPEHSVYKHLIQMKLHLVKHEVALNEDMMHLIRKTDHKISSQIMAYWKSQECKCQFSKGSSTQERSP